GTLLGPGALALLAAAGVDRVCIRRLPRVAIRVTGNELVLPGATLAPGQIYESIGLMLSVLAQTAGADPQLAPPVPDDPAQVRAALESAADTADLLLTAGGASVGDYDLVRSALLEAGGSVEQWRLAIKPGKPFFRGLLHGCPILGVPGNPVSAFVTTVLLVLPALRRLQGATDVLPPTVPGFLEEPLSNGAERRHFVRVIREADGRVRSAGVQGSHRLASLAVANGLVDIPPRTQLRAGSRVAVICW
ncbi:MAG: molybdopterin molybdotransferase MoeA, partial [Verrucomicrobiae bacterium]|nr:molybdopterin molybdotransferase MoeA [Verrucomicrobiae bacterium]